MSIFQGSTFSEIAALLTVVSALGGALAWLIKQHHLSTFVTKRAYYAQREEDHAMAKEQKTLTEADTKEHREKILAQMTELNTNMSQFMLKIAEWKSDFQTRVSLLEDREKRGRRPGR